MLEKKIKEIYEYCEKYNLSEEEKKELSDYIEILSKNYLSLQNKINNLSDVNLNKNIGILIRAKYGNKTKD